MRYYLKLIWQTLKVFILFTGCTILFYYAIMWVNEEYQNLHRYDEPKGNAVKVNSTIENVEKTNWLNRLLLFYLNGE